MFAQRSSRVSVLASFLFLILVLLLPSTAFADTLYWYANTQTMPTPRFGAATGVVGNDIYMLGGGTTFGPGFGAMATVERYDTSNNTWSVETSMSVSRFGAGEAQQGGLIYVVGGHSGTAPTNTVLQYDTSTGVTTTLGTLVTSRFLADTALINNTIYVVGGRGAGNTVLNTIEAFDLSTNTSQIIAQLPAARDRAGVIAYGNDLLIFGGSDAAYNATNTCWSYDTTQNPFGTFTTLSPMPISVFGGIRGTATVNGRFYVAGGGTNNSLPPTTCTANVQEYDPATNTWALKASMPTARLGASAASVGNRIYMLGGHNIVSALSTNEYAIAQAGTTDLATPVAGPGDIVCGVIRVTFPSGTSSGELVVSESATGPSGPPSNVLFAGRYYDIGTSAQFTGTLSITIPYDDSLFSGPESGLRLYHWDGNAWVDVTGSVDTTNNTITGLATSLSPFVVGEEISTSSGFGMNTNILFGFACLLLIGGAFILRKQYII